MRSLLLTHLAMLTLLAACGPAEFPGQEAPPYVGGKADTWEQKLAFAKQVKPGDVFVTSSSEGEDCWYLSDWENWATKPRFCHAGLVIAKECDTCIDTIEALNESQGIQVQRDEASYLAHAKKLAILRVEHDDGSALSPDEVRRVIDTAMGWQDVPYREPPISMHGDVAETGLYCSMLPWRAHLDGAGIDLDAWSFSRSIIVPFIVTPDELYESPNVRVIYERAPDIQAEDEIPEDEPSIQGEEGQPEEGQPEEEPPPEEPDDYGPWGP